MRIVLTFKFMKSGVVYCAANVSNLENNKPYGIFNGKAKGFGYDKRSAAAWDALKHCKDFMAVLPDGWRLDGCGLSVMRDIRFTEVAWLELREDVETYVYERKFAGNI